MVKVTSPLLYAVGELNGLATVNNVQSFALDFSVRAPFGVMIDRIHLYANFNQIATVQGNSLTVAVFKDPDTPNVADFIPAAGVVNAVGQSNLNTDVLAIGWRSHYATTGVADTTVRVPQVEDGPIATFDWLTVPLESRPITVRPMQFGTLLEVETGIAAQTYVSGFHLTYQTVELDDSELVGLVASR